MAHLDFFQGGHPVPHVPAPQQFLVDVAELLHVAYQLIQTQRNDESEPNLACPAPRLRLCTVKSS